MEKSFFISKLSYNLISFNKIIWDLLFSFPERNSTIAFCNKQSVVYKWNTMEYLVQDFVVITFMLKSVKIFYNHNLQTLSYLVDKSLLLRECFPTCKGLTYSYSDILCKKSIAARRRK